MHKIWWLSALRGPRPDSCMTKRKIAILLPAMQSGGAERFVSNLINFLSSEFEVHLILFDRLVEYALPETQIFHIIDGNSHTDGNFANILKLPLLGGRVCKYCNQNGIELVISFLHRPNFVACIAKKMGLKAKVIISERTYAPIYFKKGTLSGKIGSCMVSKLYPIADYILPNSKGVQDALSTVYGIKNRYRVIKNIVDIKNIELQKQKPVGDIAFDKFTFITVANLNEGKNHEMLLNAFSAMNTDDAQLLLIGKGKLREKLQLRAVALGVGDRVVFLGYQANPFNFIGRSDCFVFPSDFEGFPNVLIEALACGTPVISTDCRSGPRELLAPETDCRQQVTDRFEVADYGILVPVGDAKLMAEAMGRIRQDASLRDALKQRSAMRAADFDGERMAEEIKNVILEVL